MEIKYEPVFGPQELFDDAPIEATHATQGGGFYRATDGGGVQYLSRGPLNGDMCKCIDGYLIAERRIIRTPTWTAADQKVGRLPDVGCLVVSKTGKVSEVATIKNGYFILFECGKSNGPLTMHGDLLMKQFKPLESPEEKAARLRSEWAKKASEFIDDELDCVNLVGEHVMRRFYNAMLSGDLPVPVAPEQNK